MKGNIISKSGGEKSEGPIHGQRERKGGWVG